jgi:hypothetical protein
LGAIDGYRVAEPFPHLVIDDFFRAECLDLVCGEWPGQSTEHLSVFDDGTFVTNKKASSYKTPLGQYTNYVLHCLCEPPFLEALENVTGIEGLIPDPFRRGGGLHFTGIGGKLAIHADFNKHFKYKLDRRLNLIVYLNRGWTPSNGGSLELWDKEMHRRCKSILPVFNRMVIFSTSRTSYHGHPDPVAGPPTLLRKSIAMYYYTNGREDSEARQEHATLWQERPGQGYL